MMSYSLMRLTELNDLCTKMNPNIDEKIMAGDYINVLDFVHEMRKSIADIDYRLDDCTNLLTAHQGYLTSKFLPEEQVQTPQEQPVEYPAESYCDPAATTNEIEEKISKLKNMVEAAGSDA